MFRRLVVVLVLFVLSSFALAQSDSREFSGWQWYDNGVHLNYSYLVADNVGARWIAATVRDPEKMQIFFENYHGNGQWIETSDKINIIPVSTLKDGDIPLLQTLQGLSVNSLDVIQGQLGQVVQSGDIPIVVDQARLLDFQSGNGVRFVAIAGGDMNVKRLSYRYLGITADNNYLIMALFPLTTSYLNQQSVDDLSQFSAYFETLDAMMTSLTVTTPDAMFVTKQTNAQIDYDGVKFTYAANLAYRVDVDAVEAVTGVEAQQSMYGAMPGYQRFTFVGFPTAGNIQSPQLYVMPVSEFPAEGQIYGDQLHLLQNLLRTHPELKAIASPGSQETPLPILPVINAAQTIVLQPQYMRFLNGEGVRYITYYSQSAEPVTANDLFYAFVGITDDGQYVVSALFPLYADFLPQGWVAYNISNWEDFMMNYQTYLDDLLREIANKDASAYMPDIRQLDSIIATVEVK